MSDYPEYVEVEVMSVIKRNTRRADDDSGTKYIIDDLGALAQVLLKHFHGERK
jgi:hypothetical protein